MTAAVEEMRTPPQDVDAERGVLGGMLLSKDAIEDVVPVLKPGDFYRPAHQIVFETMVELYSHGHPADAVSVNAELIKTGKLARIPGGSSYLVDLISSVPTAANAGYYAEIVARAAVLRRLVEAGTRIVQLGYGAAEGHGGEPHEVLDQAWAEIEAVAHPVNTDGPVSLLELAEPAMAEVDRLAEGAPSASRVPTGLIDLDRLLGGGLTAGSMTIVAARPGVGKSVLAAQILRYAASRHKMPTLLFSLEMSRMEIMFRLLASQAKIDHQALLSGRLADDEWAMLARAAGELSDAPMSIADAPGLTPSQGLSISRRFQQRHGLRAVAVDYVQLMMSGQRQESRQVEVSDFSRQMKLWAKTLGIALIAVAQLNRGPEQRTDKKPILSDLRESGSLEQDADNVVLLHRPDMYSPDDRPGEADLILAKQRGGPTGVVPVYFQGRFSRFVDQSNSAWAA